MAAAHSAQDMVRPGECVDMYYYDGESAKKQCFATTQNTKYIQQFANLTGGSSVFTIPPQNGIQDIVCEFTVPALSGAGAALGSLELPRAWGYALISQVSFRYGGSSQYFLSGDQIFQNALRRQTSRTSADDIATLGGNYATGAGGAAGNLDVAQTAAIVLTLPHNIPSGAGKAHPLPTDLLTQQVQVTVELKPLASVFGIAAGSVGGAAAIPSSLAFAQFQVQQVMLNNQSDALARRVDMSVNAYAFPCEFVQQVVRVPLAAGAGSQPVTLTGFRSGEVKAIHCWLTRGADQNNAQNTPAGAAYNPFNWYLPSAVVMTYAGDVYARYEYGSSPLWNLINGDKAPAWDNNVVADSGSQTFTASPALSQWVELPFAQTLVDEDAHHTLVHGRSITNGIVNLQVTPPSSQTDWVLNISYLYNATLLFSQGSCDYVF